MSRDIVSKTIDHAAEGSVGPAEAIRVLFLHARDYLTPDLAVHYSLMAAFDKSRTKPFVVSNSQAKDVERHLIANATNPRLTSYLIPLGVPVAEDGHASIRDQILSLLSCAAVVPRLWRLARRHRIQLIHSTDRPRDIFLAILLAKAARLPNIIHLHTNVGAYHNRVIQWGFRRTTAFFTVSQFIRQEGLGLGLPEAALHPVPNASDFLHFDPKLFANQLPALRQELRGRFGLLNSTVLLGIVARVNEWKGQRELIEAIAVLAGRYPDLYLLIVGGNSDPVKFTEYEKQLAERARGLNVLDRIIFAGRFEDVRPILAALDIFALPSYEEPFGLAITEAMAMELPVIACDSGGVPEIIEDGHTGCLVEPRSVPSLANAIQYLIEHADIARKMGQAARRHVVEAYAPEIIAGQVSNIYQKIVAQEQ